MRRIGLPKITIVSLCAVAAIVVAVGPAPGASSTVVVGATVPSATNLDVAGCASGSPGRTDFGTVLPNTLAVTTVDCSVTFGSSNDTARLRIRQSDGLGSAMFQPSRGVVDAAFGTAGHVSTATAPTTGLDYAYAMAVQSDGRIVTAGTCAMGPPSGQDFCLARYLANGTLDTTFDSDGRVTIDIAPLSGTDTASALTIDASGRIVAAGSCDMGAGNNDLCVARFNSNGSLDNTFSGDGKATTDPTGNYDSAQGVVTLDDGRIVIAGVCYSDVVTTLDACVIRYRQDGSLDPTFDTDGVSVFRATPGAANDIMYAVALQPDGNVVTAGTCVMGASSNDACVMRIRQDGSLDPSFGGDGIVTTPVGGAIDAAFSIALQSNGRVLAGGYCDMGASGYDMCAVRYESDGDLDPTFDTDGMVSTTIAPAAGLEVANGILEQPDGRIVLTGRCDMAGATGFDVCVARLTAGGALDPTFDSDGYVITRTAPAAGMDNVFALASPSDGRLLIAGYCDMAGTTGFDACITQLDTGGVVSQYANTSTDWDTPGTNLFGACLRTSTLATANWTANATCPATDGAYWNAVSTTPSQIAVANPSQTASTAQLRFGLRTTAAQAPGSYVAPVTFDVVAP